MARAILVIISLCLLGAEKKVDHHLQGLQDVLSILHLPLMAGAFITRKPHIALMAGGVSAGAFILRSINGTDEEDSKYMYWVNRIMIPTSLVGGWAASRMVLSSGAKRLIMRKWSDKSWRQRFAELEVLTGFILSRGIDAHAHIRRGENPLTTKNYYIGTAYNVLGAFMGRYVLMQSDTLKHRIIGAAALSAAYTFTNIWTQDVQRLIWGSEFNPRNLKFDNAWGTFQSTPRNLIYWWGWNALVSSPALSAGQIATLTTTIKIVDGLHRKYWYANAKLKYLREDVPFWRALF